MKESVVKNLARRKTSSLPDRHGRFSLVRSLREASFPDMHGGFSLVRSPSGNKRHPFQIRVAAWQLLCGEEPCAKRKASFPDRHGAFL